MGQCGDGSTWSLHRRGPLVDCQPLLEDQVLPSPCQPIQACLPDALQACSTPQQERCLVLVGHRHFAWFCRMKSWLAIHQWSPQQMKRTKQSWMSMTKHNETTLLMGCRAWKSGWHSTQLNAMIAWSCQVPRRLLNRLCFDRSAISAERQGT